SVTRTEHGVLEQRAAARRQQNRNAVRRGVERPADGVGRSDAGMDHDRLDAPVAQIGAMGHRNGEILVRAHHQLWEIQSRLLLASVRLDDGAKSVPAFTNSRLTPRSCSTLR